MNIKSYAGNIFKSWIEEDIEKVLNLIETKKGSLLLDAGCGDGKLTKLFVKKTKGNAIGIEGLLVRIKGIKVVKANINNKLPFLDETFDVVVSHYSLEHLYNSGEFIHETYRVLKKGGYIVVATDNLASWPNIISMVLGFQPFSTTMGVGKAALGNPFALRANIGDLGGSKLSRQSSKSGEFSHNKVMAYQMLVDSYKEYNFKIEKVVGVGYFPFYGFLSRLFCKIDKRHSHLLIMKARK